MRSILIIATTLLALQGCAAYTIGSGVVYVFSDKTPGDHAASTLAQADCNAVRTVAQGTYYCEQRDISKTYNKQWP